MYKRILVATGGSPWSDAAVEYAITMATCMKAELRILTVLTMPAASAMVDVMGFSDVMLDSIEQEGKTILAQAASRAAWAGIDWQTILQWGSVPEAILRTADEEACDAIILGSRELTGWKRLMLGTISNAVAASSSQPVLIVKPSALPVTQPLWRRILVATGGSPWSEAAVTHALALAKAQQLEVFLLCVKPPWRRRERAAETENQEQALGQATAQAVEAGVPHAASLVHGEVAATILDVADKAACDAIILGSRGLTGWKRLMLGSVSGVVATKAALPVLIAKRCV